jgi:PEGA domain
LTCFHIIEKSSRSTRVTLDDWCGTSIAWKDARVRFAALKAAPTRLNRYGGLHMPTGKIGCNSCGNVYPAYFRFCPIDASELHPAAVPMHHVSKSKLHNSMRRGATGRLTVCIAGLMAMAVLVSCAGFMVETLRPRYGQLHVRTSPPGATIFVDGQQLGTSPIILSELPSGRHQVRAAMPGYQGTIRYIRINADASEIVEWRLEPVQRLPNLQLTQISSSRQRRES